MNLIEQESLMDYFDGTISNGYALNAQLVESISKSAGIRRDQAYLFLTEFVELCQRTIASGEAVKIEGLGTFKYIEPHNAGQIVSGSISVGGSGSVKRYRGKQIYFRPSQALADAIN